MLLQQISDRSEGVFDVGDDAGVVIVCPIETTADISGFPVGQYLTYELHVRRAFGIGIDKSEIDQGLIEVMPLPSDIGLILWLRQLIAGKIPTDVLPYPCECL